MSLGEFFCAEAEQFRATGDLLLYFCGPLHVLYATLLGSSPQHVTDLTGLTQRLSLVIACSCET